MLYNASMTSVVDAYKALSDAETIEWDQAQFELIQQLDTLASEISRTEGTSDGFFSRFKKRHNPKGIYLWGGVGRGKTFVMDLFFDALVDTPKLRLHFHRFMQSVHEQLNAHSGQENPLELIADDMREKCKVLCFDEFFVTDITDAMILGELLKALFSRGVILVATSNIIPENLYRNGLQRERFLPAIELIIENCVVIQLESQADYRLRALELAEIYHHPLDQQAADNLTETFAKIATGEVRNDHELVINGRSIETIQRADGVLWCSFAALCQTERSAADYIEISKLYHTVLLADMPALGDTQNDAVRRFIALVDEFYERQVKLIISAEKSLHTLYSGTAQAFAFQRTESRLIEMQSHHYLALPHLA